MAQMFSSGVTPDYLKALSDAYAQYFPQQAPVDTQALQQWYSPQGGSSAFAAPMGASAVPSVVGSLFGEQYPQVNQGGGGSQMSQGFMGDTANVGATGDFSGLMSGLGTGLQSVASMGLLGPVAKLAALAYGAYNKDKPFGTAPSMSDAGLAAAISGQDAANARDSAPSYGGGGGDRGGVATGGNGGDASGGGDRGTRGGW